MFDGPVDSLWIQSMNRIMDDSKVLTLINAYRISMPEQNLKPGQLNIETSTFSSRCSFLVNAHRQRENLVVSNNKELDSFQFNFQFIVKVIIQGRHLILYCTYDSSKANKLELSCREETVE